MKRDTAVICIAAATAMYMLHIYVHAMSESYLGTIIPLKCNGYRHIYSIAATENDMQLVVLSIDVIPLIIQSLNMQYTYYVYQISAPIVMI